MAFEDSLLAVFWIFSAFWISKATIPVLILVASKKRLFDTDIEDRKIHKGLVPTFGGIAIFAAILICFSASSFAESIPGYGYMVAASAILFTAGIKDDILIISPSKKLIAQFAASALVIFGSGIYFSNLGGVFGVHEIPLWLGIPLSFFMMIVVINSLNLVDGIDGLAGSIGIVASLFFGFWFYLAEFYGLAVFSGVVSASLAGFLWYNLPPAKIFMGDTGSLLIGFYLAVFALYFVNYSITTESVIMWQSGAPVLAAAVLVVPLYDTLRIFFVRLLRGGSPFVPDTDHVHHHLLRLGFSHGKTTLYLIGVTIIASGGVLILSSYLSNSWLLVFLLIFSFSIFPTMQWQKTLLKSMFDIVPPEKFNGHKPYLDEAVQDSVDETREEIISEEEKLEHV